MTRENITAKLSPNGESIISAEELIQKHDLSENEVENVTRFSYVIKNSQHSRIASKSEPCSAGFLDYMNNCLIEIIQLYNEPPPSLLRYQHVSMELTYITDGAADIKPAKK